MGAVLDAVQDATSVRKTWGGFIDGVVHRGRPAVVKRNRDLLAAMSLDVLRQVLAVYTFTIHYRKEDDASYSGSLKEVDLVGNAPTAESLRYALAEELVEYAREYWQEFELYYNSPNRKVHLPYVLHVLIQESADDVAALIHA